MSPISTCAFSSAIFVIALARKTLPLVSVAAVRVGVPILFVFPLALVQVTQATGQEVVNRLETTDLQGNPISFANAGENFQLRSYVQDTRNEPVGVFAFYSDVIFPADFVSLTGPRLQFSDAFPNGTYGDTATTGLLDEIGSFSGEFTGTGGDEVLQWTATFTAEEVGLASFVADPADDLPAREVNLFGIDTPIPFEQTVYGSASLTIVPEPTTTFTLWPALFTVLWCVRRSR